MWNSMRAVSSVVPIDCQKFFHWTTHYSPACRFRRSMYEAGNNKPTNLVFPCLFTACIRNAFPRFNYIIIVPPTSLIMIVLGIWRIIVKISLVLVHKLFEPYTLLNWLDPWNLVRSIDILSPRESSWSSSCHRQWGYSSNLINRRAKMLGKCSFEDKKMSCVTCVLQKIMRTDLSWVMMHETSGLPSIVPRRATRE